MRTRLLKIVALILFSQKKGVRTKCSAPNKSACCLDAHNIKTSLSNLNELQRIDALRRIESQLIDKALYWPLFHVQQQISTATSLDATDMLANGWIDFATVVVE